MTSLSETYGGGGRSEVNPRRLSIGVGLFVGGTLLLVIGLLTAAEVLFSGRFTSGAARRYGGILGGLGVPIVMLGIMIVLPADRNTRVAALIGAAIMALGVALFAHAYPQQWVGGPNPELTDLTLPTAGVYLLGAATTLWCLFVGIANFKTRNDPGGTVTMEVTHKGETKVIEVERDQLDGLNGLGGVGFLGGTPDGEVETQTNRPDTGTSTTTADRTISRRKDRSPGGPTTGVSDGGESTTTITSPMDDHGTTTSSAEPASPTGPASPDGPASPPGPAPSGGPAADAAGRQSKGRDRSAAAPRDGPGDAYCGNCARFDYVQTDDGMRPYCGHYDELMDDMEACDQWVPR
ncbi:DUF7139 domain-containing protein [Halorubrum vacuolatum]|uniref:Uncharacterized protein n=1 Tax=Halorubrum vacuolatum TaxID=63740 RepID=A0A238WAL8_HALVU|nr:tripartite tricarboxylate transporter TctB family protein [Halorubrum vacuolatum]SNR43457.1 hypothetical protein SAMN06264855_10697 [Halorubrum vacuolatum]